MKRNIPIGVVAAIIFILAAATVYVVNKTNEINIAREESIVSGIKPVNTEAVSQTQENDQQSGIPEEIRKVMNNNITGTVESVNAESIVIKSGDGTIKKMSVKDGKTFVISQSDRDMENKKISDIKIGMTAFVHFEKETDLAVTITLLQ